MKKSEAQQCYACGIKLDTDAAVRIAHGNHTYCSRCYLRYNNRGELKKSGQASQNVLHVATPQGIKKKAQASEIHSILPPVNSPVELPAATPPTSPPIAGPTAPAPAPAVSSFDFAAIIESLAQTPTLREVTPVPVPVPVPPPHRPAPHRPMPLHKSPTEAPHVARIRAALACAHTARRVYEYYRYGDNRLRPILALVSEVASGSRRHTGSTTLDKLRAALVSVRRIEVSADMPVTAALASVEDTAEAALAVLRQDPWRTLDLHAHNAYNHAAEAVLQAWAAAGKETQALSEALDGQDERAFRRAASLWPDSRRSN